MERERFRKSKVKQRLAKLDSKSIENVSIQDLYKRRSNYTIAEIRERLERGR